MSQARKLLIFGGIFLAALGMLYGLHYAVFVEHQTLDRMGGSLAGAFTHAAERRVDDSHLALISYRETKYDYIRQVDVHSHWIGLAMLMLGYVLLSKGSITAAPILIVGAFPILAAGIWLGWD